MSFYGSHAEAKACIAEVEVSENTHSSSGSKILAGHNHPHAGEGNAYHDKPSGETLMPGRLRAGIKTPLTRTDTLTRKYASTGSGGESGS